MSEPIIQPYPPQDGDDWDCCCARCGSSADWRRCDWCGGGGLDGHDCGEDTCCCGSPEDNVDCHICDGHGGDYCCLSSAEWCQANPLPGRDAINRGKIEWFQIEEREV